MEEEEYSMLKDFRLEIEREDKNFSICFWVYLMNSTTFPATILKQVYSNATNIAPFLALNEKKQVILLPFHIFHAEDTDPNISTYWTEVPHASTEIEFPLGRWVHIGCEVSTDFLRIHIDGKTAGEKIMSSSFSKYHISSDSRKISLVSGVGDDNNSVQGYVHNAEALSLNSSVEDHYAKHDPPVQLSIDDTSASEIEVDSGGAWSIVGGKASCRKVVSLDALLLDASGQAVVKEMEVVASLVYADNGEPVEKSSDAEAPLLVSCDGIEFASCDRPSNFYRGRASFKLKISQLSSKCNNRLFRIRFYVPQMGRYPFFEVFSPPIRCISRSRYTRISSLICKRSASSSQPVDISPSSGWDNGNSELDNKSIHKDKRSPSKRVRLGQDRTCATLNEVHTFEQPDEECNSHAFTTNQAENARGTNSMGRHGNNEEADDSSFDSESNEARNLALNTTSSSRNPVSDVNIFKYCLAGLSERSLLLKDITTSVSNEEVLEFASQVSLYSGCSHHRHQILMAKRLIEEGTQAWNLISQNNHHVHWESVVYEIEEIFMRIACCSSRSLTQQDFELLRRIASCQEYLAQENFERMWCWLYPVAFMLSRECINTIWSSTSPKWIEGFITKEEAESSLQGPRGIQEPGTFILRFPTSRSWPHPDAGSLVVTYIGSDYAIHHRLLSLDHIYSSSQTGKNVKPLKDLLLAEPELSQLGRIIRSH